MTTARARLVSPHLTHWYHCVTGCVRQTFILRDDKGTGDRKRWMEERLKFLGAIFAISVAGFAIMDNHLHLLLRLDTEEGNSWSPREVVLRWFQIFPPRGKNRRPLHGPALDKRIEECENDDEWVTSHRERLQSLSWFMKLLKEPFSRMINQEENTRGAVFEGRFKSIAILDEEALLATCAYIDLNPIAAGTAVTPEGADYTSAKRRIDHAIGHGRLRDLRKAVQGSVAASAAGRGVEEKLWLIPIEDRSDNDSRRRGMFKSFTLGNYLLLLDYVGRLSRDGKARMSAKLDGIFARLGTTADSWLSRVVDTKTRLVGRFFASKRITLCETAAKAGFHHITNLNGFPAA